eukprot:CAMPEP_0197635416 /NCGR_PEP_ID=MMETSP1338-20131121/11238_1 /TAXON_ID=43686 ORGANISM="Pelagodinium beii, Strain RCC1491" /NCGR_SAMPLE_ID=MMETSP1338 /ASSEMBLY_ACC=CAM_ASM_000754 /LENGTH=174 /DNA_ID=CAMNT_0043207459 /DNA_START=93 /DNA_END=615 /DNA_ORIENTATION=-
MMQLSVASILSLWFMLLGGTASQKCGADNPFCQEEDGSNYMLQHDAGHVRSKSKVQATEETGSNTSERVNTSSNASWSWGGGSDCISLTPADGCRPIAACTDSNVLCCLPVIPSSTRAQTLPYLRSRQQLADQDNCVMLLGSYRVFQLEINSMELASAQAYYILPAAIRSASPP